MALYTVRFKTHHDAYRELKKHFTLKTDKTEYAAGLLCNPAPSRRAVYFHVPFCNKICSFCPFHRPDALSRKAYHTYLIDEMRALSGFEYMRAPIGAVNFGGGTPTALDPEQIDAVLKEFKNRFVLEPNAEISVETSVNGLSDEMLAVLKENGVNRLSVGVQTFDDGTRKLLNRKGGGENAALTLEKAVRFGFKNTGVDLIYNYPRQTTEMLERDLNVIKSLNLAGVSFYSLMLHETTPLFNRLSEEEKRLMEDTGREYELFSMIIDGLGAAGYSVFELTKLIRDGIDRYEYMRIRHTCGSCIAIGHGAGGNLENYIYSNSVTAQSLSDTVPISARGRIVSDKYRVLDEFINELQKTETDLAAYSERLDVDLAAVLRPLCDKAAVEGLITAADNKIAFTKRGLFWGNNIISDCIALIINAAVDG
ncbi:MAG: coproporphyrinogen III oxidase family protein [Clostridiales bacterium]|jgi:oxygen-independent coproporphyrinogen-3 oxidase|nr:coproporphyrinogen III oxidase family protein [Clostridiales bacterium]